MTTLEIPKLIEDAWAHAMPGREAVAVNEILRAIVRELQQWTHAQRPAVESRIVLVAPVIDHDGNF